jgi:hypothetical protein
VIVGVKNFSKNVYDGDTLSAALTQIEASSGKYPLRAFVDRGLPKAERW